MCAVERRFTLVGANPTPNNSRFPAGSVISHIVLEDSGSFISDCSALICLGFRFIVGQENMSCRLFFSKQPVIEKAVFGSGGFGAGSQVTNPVHFPRKPPEFCRERALSEQIAALER